MGKKQSKKGQRTEYHRKFKTVKKSHSDKPKKSASRKVK